MNLRHYLQTRLPKASELSEKRFIGWFGHRLHDPNLWHFGRRSVSRAAAVGLLLAFIPIPVQMTIIVPLAILRGINLPVAIAALWVTNPLTWVPLFYAAYRLGLLFTGGTVQTAESLQLGANWESLSNALGEIWLPLCLGSAMLGIIAAASGYFLIDGLWRLGVARRWRQRAARRRAQA